MSMISIQISFDEDLLRELDATREAREKGRSAVFRKAVAEYLHRRRGEEIAEAYLRAYGDDESPGDELDGWSEEGVWPKS